MIYKDTINGKNLLTQFGLIIQTGTAGLLEFPERKESISNDWSDENGIERDLAAPKFKDNEVTLKCGILANDDTAFWAFYDALFIELSRPNFQELYIDDHSRAYQVFYKKSGNFNKVTKRLKGLGTKVFVKFDLTFQVKYL